MELRIELYSLTIDTIKVIMHYKLQRVLVWNKKAAELSMLMRLFCGLYPGYCTLGVSGKEVNHNGQRASQMV